MQLFEGVPRNTKWTVALEPASSALSTAVNFFLPLLMKNTGLSEMEIGLVSTVNLLAGCVFQLAAPAIVNRFGRRRTLLVCSLVCWSAPLALWTVAGSFPFFFAATLFQSTARITTIAHYCYLTEDVPNDRKAGIFGFLSLASAVGGAFTCLLSPVVSRWGVVSAARLLNGISCICMTLMFLIRYRKTTETRVGMELLGRKEVTRKLLRFPLGGIRRMLRDMASRKLILLFILWSFATAMGFMLTIYLEDILLLPADMIAFMPAVTAIAGAGLFVLYLHRRVRERKVLAAAIAANLAAYALLCLIPARNLWMVVAFYVLLSCGNYWYSISMNPLLNNCMAEHEKAETYSSIQLLVTLSSTPAGVLTGTLYRVNPLLPFAVILGIFALCGLLYVALCQQQR